MNLIMSSLTDPFYHPNAPVPSIELCKVEDKCFSCDSYNLIEDYGRGDVVCTECGYIQTERLIADDQADFRIFSDDDGHKNHFGQATSVFYPGQLTSPNKLYKHDDVEFLWRGFKSIRSLVERVQRGKGCHQGVESAAKGIFFRAYEMMLSEKKGTKKMARTNEDRQRFARLKTFVVAAVWRSLHKFVYCYLTEAERKDQEKYKLVLHTPETLSAMLPGAKVTRNSVNKCLKEIGEW